MEKKLAKYNAFVEKDSLPPSKQKKLSDLIAERMNKIEKLHNSILILII